MFLQAAVEGAPSLIEENRLLTIITESDIIIQVIFGILVCFSVLSWAIIIAKWSQIKFARTRIADFATTFNDSTSVEHFIKDGKHPKGPGLQIMQGGLAPLRRSQPGDATDVQRGIERSLSTELSTLEAYLPFLATTASATPFIGLLGTVWGILNAFWEISSAGSSSLQVVGPSIAEALFVTAVGLVAAIPALIFYNILTNKIRMMTRDLEQLGADMSHRIAREYCDRAA